MYPVVTPLGSNGQFQSTAQKVALVKPCGLQGKTKSHESGKGTGGVGINRMISEGCRESTQNAFYTCVQL